MEEQFRVSSFRTKIYLGGCREIVASINHSSPNLVQQTIFPPTSNPSSRFERISLLLYRVNQWENLSQGRACVSVASSQSTAGLGEL